MPTPNPAARALAVLAFLPVAVAGCLMQGDYSVGVTTADGVHMEVPLNTLPPEATDGDVTVKKLSFSPWAMDKGKGLAFAFIIEFKPGLKPAVIEVDDVSEAPIVDIFTDKAPVLTKNVFWGGLSPPYHPSDERARWIMNLDNSVKVYRFTVRLSDGTTHVLRYAIFIPGPVKAMMRAQLGVAS